MTDQTEQLEGIDALMVIANTTMLSLLTVAGAVLTLSATPADVKAIGVLVGVSAGSVFFGWIAKVQIARRVQSKESTEKA